MTKPGTDGSTAWRSAAPRPGVGDVAALVVWTAAITAFFWDFVSLRAALFYFDITEINFPYRDFLARQLREGRFSRWFPGLYCGMPLYSESQAGYLHPLKFVLYPWMETWKAFNLDTIGSVWLTGLGTYGWLRRHVGPRGALTGAAIFGLSGFVWAHLIHTSMNNALTSVPFVVWAVEIAWDRRRTLGIALGGFALACQVFAGHLQDTLFTAALVAFYTVARSVTESDRRARLRTLMIGGATVALGIALSAVQWIPSKELLDRSPRAGGLTWSDLTYGSWHPELLPTLVIREAYGTRARDTDWMDGFYPYHEMNAYLGLTAMALAVIGAGASRDRWTAFWILLALVGMTLMLGRFTFLFDSMHRIPVIGSSRIPVRFHLWVSLATAALAAVGVDRIERGFPIWLRGAGSLVGMLLIGSLPILFYAYLPALTHPETWTDPYHLARFDWLSSELIRATLRTLALIAIGGAAIVVGSKTRSDRTRGLACSVLPLVVLADLLGSHWRDVPGVTPAYWISPPLSAQRLRRDPACVRIFGVAEKSAGEPGYASQQIDFLSVRDPLDWSLAPVWDVASARGETPIIPMRMLEFTDHAAPTVRFDLQSVTHILGTRRKPLRLGRPAQAGEALIYRNDRAFPRARLAGRPVYVSGEADAIAALQRLGDGIRDQLVVEDPDRPLDPAQLVEGTAEITRDEPEEVEIATKSAGPSYLILADTFDPGWRATVDGRPAPIRPAWLTFRAVYLAAGDHRVRFSYQPAGFALGRMISLAGLLVACLLVAWPRPLPMLDDPHSLLTWRSTWPGRGLLLIGFLVLVSMAGWSQERGLGLSWRWRESFHQFTWGAGIEAMRKTSAP